MNHNNQTTEGFVNKCELAKLCRKCPRTISNWVRDRQIPYLKLGKSLLFDWVEVRQHLAAHNKVAATSSPNRVAGNGKPV